MKQVCGSLLVRLASDGSVSDQRAVILNAFTFEPGCVIRKNDFVQYFMPLTVMTPLFPCQILRVRCL